jgi:aquaporin Z
MTRKLIAELLGTAILVFFGCGTAALMFGLHLAGVWGAGVVVTALAFGLVLAGICYAFGAVSGAHVNPAVTLGALVAGRIKMGDAVAYWVVQFAGGILGVLVLWAMLSGSPYFSRSKTGLGANGYGSLSLIHMDWSGAFVIEIVMTAVFVYVILSVTAKAGSPIVAGLVIGLTLATVHLIGISVDGTGVNPARSLAPALIVGGTALKQVWLFLCAPLVGALLAAAVYRAMHPDEVDTVYDDEDDDPSGAGPAGATTEPEPEPAPAV